LIMAKKILIDARLYGLEHAGIGRYLINLIKELKKLDTKERFIILLRKKYYYSLKLPPEWEKILVDLGIYGFGEQLKLPYLLLKQKPDLVHFPHINIPILWRGKFVVTVHDLTMQRQGSNASRLPLPLYYFKRVPFLLIAHKAVKEAVKIITPTESVKKDVVNYYSINENKIETIYEGISALTDNYSKISVKIKKPYIFYIGSAYPHKNLFRLIEAIKFLNEKTGTEKKASLVIAGSKNFFKERLRKQAKKIGAEKYIKLLGYVQDSDLFSLYKESVAFIYPSLSEGFGLQGLEAMKTGTLVLASDIPVFREIYKGNAQYFNPYDFTEIAKAMKSALELGSSERERLIAIAQKFIQKYSWNKTAKDTYDLYENAIHGG
jgi:glycosyltransferase involved in cell wall biosynthesis